MATVTILAVNQTASPVTLTQLMAPDRAIPASGSVLLTDYNPVEEIIRDTELLGYLNADTVRFTVNGVVLTKNQSLEFRNAPTVSVKTNLGLTSSAPTATDDRAAGYSIGSLWITTTGDVYTCTNDTATAAVWLYLPDVTLQSAYNGGNTIVTAASTPIQFSLTSGGFTVDGAGAVNIGATADVQTINVGTGAAAKTVAVGSSNGASSLNLDAGTGAINIGSSASARAINIGTGAAVVETISIGGTGANVIAVGNTQTAGSVSVGAAMTTGTINVGGTGAQTGTIDIGVGTGAQSLNVGTGAAAKTITVGNSTGATTLNLTAGTGNTNVTTAFALTGDISPASIGANQNDYNPTGLSGASTLRLTSSAAYNITGLAGGADGRVLTVHNVGSFPLTFSNEDAASTAANRFALPNGGNITLPAKGAAILQYDSTGARWRTASMTWDPSTVGSQMIVIYTENEASTSTTGATYITHMTINYTVTAGTAGNYMVFWDAHITNSSSSATLQARIWLGSTITLNLLTSGVPANGAEYAWAGHKRITLAAGAHTIEMQFNHLAGSGSTSMQDAHMSLWRIS